MKALMDWSQNISTALRDFGDRTWLPVLCILIGVGVLLYLYGWIKHSIKKGK